MRFDDTNPAKEELEYVVAIKEDVSWLGYSWAKETYSSDNFQKLYEWAVFLIGQDLAYVDSQTSEQMAIQKGTPTKPRSIFVMILMNLKKHGAYVTTGPLFNSQYPCFF